MHVLLLTNYFPPEISAASHLYYDLAEALIMRGHKVTVLTGTPRYNISAEIAKYYLRKKIHVETDKGMTIIRVRMPLYAKKQKIKRGMEYFTVSSKLNTALNLLENDIDVCLTYSPPLPIGKTAVLISRKFKIPVVFNVQDIHPQALIDLGILKNKLIIFYLKGLEKRVYNSVSLITVHSEKNADIVRNLLNRNKNRVEVMHNWIDVTKLTPGEKNNDFSKKHGLLRKFVVSFAGNLGTSQDIEVIIRAADKLKNIPDILFLIVGDGVKKQETENLIKELGLENVLLLPAVKRDTYSLVLHSSDISLVTLMVDVRTPVVPSKILSIMSAGIPVIATMNLDGDAPKLIERAKAGYALPAGDAKGLAEKILELYNNPDLRKKLGKNGREYVEKNLSVQVAADKYEEIFKKVIKEYKRRNKHG